MATIVIAEDNLSSCELLARLLRREGHAVVCVGGGQDAVTATERYRPDLLILDVNLPDISGIEVLKQVRANNSLGESAAVVMFSGMSDVAVETQAFELGAADFVRKGLDWETLLVRIEQQLPKNV